MSLHRRKEISDKYNNIINIKKSKVMTTKNFNAKKMLMSTLQQ